MKKQTTRPSHSRGSQPRGWDILSQSVAGTSCPRIIPTIILTALALPTTASAESILDTPFTQLNESVPGTFNFNIRTRFEHFRTPAEERNGFSQRLRYGYTTPTFSGFSAMVEGETLYALNGSDEIHPLDQAGRGTELNQLWLQYQEDGLGQLRLGRQTYTLDDHRFIGHVGWRQNIQTFDSATLKLQITDEFTANAFYLDRVNRVNAIDEPLDGFGLNLNYALAPWLNATAFYYSLQFDNQPGWSNETAGVRLTGSQEFAPATLAYAFSYAHQRDNSANAPGADFSLDYLAGDVSLKAHGITLGTGFEHLEGDGANGFRTPLATVHAFNGHADKFLPIGGFPQGLKDHFVYLGYTIPVGSGIPIRAAYHWFSPETGSGSYGEEFDLMASYNINKSLGLIAKYGRYRPDSNAVGPGIGKKDMFTLELNYNF